MAAPPLTWDRARSLLSGRRLPAAIVDIDAVRRNAARLTQHLGPTQTLRVASKSVRHVGLLRRVQDACGPRAAGLMCFTCEEAAFLAAQGFDDLLVAYPTIDLTALGAAAAATAQGAQITLMVDAIAHLDAAAIAAEAAGCTLGIALELDVSYRRAGGALHLGARRSPIRTPAQVVALAAHAAQLEHLELRALMAYEAHVAGLPDDNPFARGQNPIKRLIKRLSVPEVTRLRAQAVQGLRGAGVDLEVVNGGGTGSVHLTARDPSVTEITAGSGFLCPHLFSYYADLDLEPAAWFACEVVRRPDPDIVTCLGGGYVASGAPSWDRLPVPAMPEGLSYLPMEGAGEVQTPLRLSPHTPPLAIGDPVLFRHAKAGELAERFNTFLLVEDGAIVAEEPTYRGQGQAFL